MWDDILAQLIKNLSSTFKVHCFLPRATSTQQGVGQWGEVGGGDRGRIQPSKLNETNLRTKISLLLQLKSYLKRHGVQNSGLLLHRQRMTRMGYEQNNCLI